MHFGALKVYCDVARCRSFSMAGQANEITQSAVSQIVSQLEKRIHAQLVDRSRRPLQLTTQGQAFYEGCKAILSQYSELEARIRGAKEEVVGTVQVAAIYSVGLGDMGQYVQRFVAEWPKAQVHIDYLHPDRVYERVQEGTADLGLVSFPRKTSKLQTLPWREEKMALACVPSHPLAGRTAVQVKDLADLNYVHFDRNLVIRRKVDHFLKENGAVIKVVLEFDSIENIKQAVAIGAGVALLPEPTLRREVKARSLVAVPLADISFTRPLGIIHRRQPRLSTVAGQFLEVLFEEQAGHSGRNGKIGTTAAGTPHPQVAKNGQRARNGFSASSK
jgi:DNA-binding transcriptional LysR family regulator